MVLPSKVLIRVFQLATVIICFALCIGIAIGGRSIVYGRSTLLHAICNMIANDVRFFNDPIFPDVKMFNQTFIGVLAVGVSAVAFCFVASCAAVIEKRVLLAVAAFLGFVVFAGATYFAIMLFVKGGNSEKIFKGAMNVAVLHYTTLDDDVNKEFQLSVKWRSFVDRVQIQGSCCGNEGPIDYQHFFPEVHVGTRKDNITAYSCLRKDANDLRMMQDVPLSCCKKPRGSAPVDVFCAANIFNRSVDYCSSGTAPAKTSFRTIHSRGCNKAMLDQPFAKTHMDIAIFCTVIGVTTLAVSVMLVALAKNAKTRKQQAAAHLQSSLRVDSVRATKIIDAAECDRSISSSLLTPNSALSAKSVQYASSRKDPSSR